MKQYAKELSWKKLSKLARKCKIPPNIALEPTAPSGRFRVGGRRPVGAAAHGGR